MPSAFRPDRSACRRVAMRSRPRSSWWALALILAALGLHADAATTAGSGLFGKVKPTYTRVLQCREGCLEKVTKTTKNELHSCERTRQRTDRQRRKSHHHSTKGCRARAHPFEAFHFLRFCCSRRRFPFRHDAKGCPLARSTF